MSLRELDVEQASALFAEMPSGQRLLSLSPRFAALDVARDPGLRCMHVAFEQEQSLWLNSIHVRALPDSDQALGAISPYGYGGPVSTNDDPAFLRQAWASYRKWCRDHAVLAEFCRFHPLAANQRYFAGEATYNRPTVCVDLKPADVVHQYNELARRKLRRAVARGAQVRWSRDPADWQAFAVFYRNAMQAMGAARWYLFGDAYFEAISSLPTAWLCVCEAEGAWWSAGVYLQGAQALEYHLGASAAPGHQAGTPYLMQHAASCWGQAQGAHWLYLGGGTSPDVDNPLLFYKKSFSRTLLPFFTGQAIHDEDRYWAVAARKGHDRASPPARILLD